MQEKFINLLPTWFKSIPHFDKILHLIAGLVIYFGSFYAIEFIISLSDFFSFLDTVYAIIPVFAIGLFKEYKDGTSTRQSTYDFIATIALPLIICIIQNF